MKLLSGQQLAEFIKNRQARQVRALRQAHGVLPKLAIVVTVDNPVIDTYIRLKQRYGADILVEVAVHRIAQSEAMATIKQLNHDSSVHGIIVQLPLENPDETDAIVDTVTPKKDVDALGVNAMYDPATPMAILWLLAGHNIELHKGKRVVIIGKGKLVGAPLLKILRASGVEVAAASKSTADLGRLARQANIIITATGSPGVLQASMIQQGAVVVDAGTASESGKTLGDVAPDVYLRSDLSITPQKGGVGPLTVCALFDNVIKAAQNSATQ